MRDDKSYNSDTVIATENKIKCQAHNYLAYRRVIEFTFIILTAPLLILLFILCSIPVFFCFRGKIIFRQKRAGIDGKSFVMYKFKTMKDCSDKEYDPFLHDEHTVTHLGHFLRRHRLDELPQVWNVLKGDMSFIGPRPEIYEHYNFFKTEIENYTNRKIVPQGITGWAQINSPHTVTVEGNRLKLKYDLFYIENVSFAMDFRIICYTLLIMLTGKYSR